MQPISYASHQFPAEVIRHAVWLYLRFTLGQRGVEELFAERGTKESYESARRCVLQFRLAFARKLRPLRLRPSDIWDLDEIVVTIQGRRMDHHQRAIDSEDEVLALLVQPKQDKAAALTPAVHNTFNVQLHLVSRYTLRNFRSETRQAWQYATAAA